MPFYGNNISSESFKSARTEPVLRVDTTSTEYLESDSKGRKFKSDDRFGASVYVSADIWLELNDRAKGSLWIELSKCVCLYTLECSWSAQRIRVAQSSVYFV